MIYDLNLYRRNMIPVIQNWFLVRPKAHKIGEISEIAISSSCPIVCVAYYVGELYGFTEELNSKIQTLEKFYKVTKIKGKINN